MGRLFLKYIYREATMKVYKFTVTFEGEGVSEAEAFEEGVM